MKRTTIFADEMLLNEFRTLSLQENKSLAEVIREAMQQYLKHQQKKGKALSIIGIGDSGKKDISERHEELLWQNSLK